MNINRHILIRELNNVATKLDGAISAEMFDTIYKELEQVTEGIERLAVCARSEKSPRAHDNEVSKNVGGGQS